MTINWFQLFSLTGIAGCLGGAISKWLEVTVFARFVEKREYQKWLRNARLKAFTNLTAELQSMGLAKEGAYDNPFEFRALASSAILLIDNEKLTTRIEEYIQDRDKHYGLTKTKKENRTPEESKIFQEEYKRLFHEANGIVADLKVLLR